MEIGIAQLIAGGAQPTVARQLQPHLAGPLARFGITTPARAAAFLAQCHVESAGFAHTEENLFYTTPGAVRSCWPTRFPTDAAARPFLRNPKALANRAYAGRNGNGDEASADGWRFRGRGLIQLTGRANYRRAAAALGISTETEPDRVAALSGAVLSAAWFWSTIRGNALADAGDIDAITRGVNGPAMREAAHRRGLSARYRRALGA
jgi:putative chitinase